MNILLSSIRQSLAVSIKRSETVQKTTNKVVQTVVRFVYQTIGTARRRVIAIKKKKLRALGRAVVVVFFFRTPRVNHIVYIPRASPVVVLT